MRLSTMFAFDFYRPEDKDFSKSTAPEDPYHDLFDQWLNEDSAHLSTPANESDAFQAFNFGLDDETGSSESHSTASKTASLPPSKSPLPSRLQFSPAQQTLTLRSRPSVTHYRVPRTAISNSELLNLEGISSVDNSHAKAPSSSASASVAGTLRRKAKFYAPPETQRGLSQKVSKTKSTEVMRPSFFYQQDTPSCHEWTQRFKQISLQTPTNTPQMSPPQTRGTYRDKKPGNISTSNYRSLQGKLEGAANVGTKSAPLQEVTTTPQTAFYEPLPTVPGLQGHGSHGDYPLMPSAAVSAGAEDQRPADERSQARPLRHPPSWGYLPISPLDLDFSTVSPTHVQPSWLHAPPENVQSYRQNAHASQPPPAMAQASPDYTSQGFLIQYETYGQFSNEDPSVGYSVMPSTQLQSNTIPDEIPIDLYGHGDPDLVDVPPPPRTPPLRSLSASPPPASPSKMRARSKGRGHKKTKSVGMLKQPKSASTLKSAKSSGNLKSPKSTAGGFAFDNFVNFTADDSNRILTGVAPSGSSKTKARREQEANEKKRKLSLAALKAIQEAGGDVEKLKAEFDDDE